MEESSSGEAGRSNVDIWKGRKSGGWRGWGDWKVIKDAGLGTRSTHCTATSRNREGGANGARVEGKERERGTGRASEDTPFHDTHPVHPTSEGTTMACRYLLRIPAERNRARQARQR